MERSKHEASSYRRGEPVRRKSGASVERFSGREGTEPQGTLPVALYADLRDYDGR